ncbi:hypothetical protein ACIBI9_36730 [Nonomuraea sp. NPDC050451]|uniref:hypothetical protein n=1 Tax=Nonomuraea sp. NPDC050451 TaxID=3364364 RepID=UPI0037BC8DC8
MSSLERDYRRLLRLYPRDHRARHEQEMLGVLMETAEPGRRHPSARDLADLIGGAVAIRLRMAASPQALARWRAATSVAALLGPLVLLAQYLPPSVNRILSRDVTSAAVQLSLQILLLLLAAGLAWRGRRWSAACSAWAAAIWFGADMVVPMASSGLAWRTSEIWPLGLVLLPFLATAALLTGAVSPRRGVRLIGRGRLLIGFAVVLASNAVLLLWPVGVLGELVPFGLAAVACGMAARSALGRRSVMLLIPVFLPLLLARMLMLVMWSGVGTQAIVVVGVALILFVVTAYLGGPREVSSTAPREVARL